MNYYSHHIGDFNNATRHLTRVEQSVYRDAIELYYDTEQCLTLDIDKLARRLICNSDEEKQALNVVLNEFFKLTDDGYFHARCDEEITKYRANTTAKAKAGIASALARQQKATGVKQPLNVCETNVQLTNNHKPITNIKGSRLSNDWILPMEWIDEAKKIKSELSNNQVIYIGEGFKDYWIGIPGAKGVRLDWIATWRNWIRNQNSLPTNDKKPDVLNGMKII